MKHIVTRFGCSHVILSIGAMISVLGAGYCGHYLTQQWRYKIVRQQELTKQTDIYQQVLQEKQLLSSAVADLQQQLAQLFQQYQTQPNIILSESLYVSELMAAAKKTKLAIVSYDPIMHEIHLNGTFQNLLKFLAEIRDLQSNFYGVNLTIAKTPKALHITYRYAMHTL